MEVKKPKVVIAGAGAGKTHKMITEIIKIIPDLLKNPESFCAVVTYTNAATEEIQSRIASVAKIPPNLHISTTHSFLIRFIVDPFAHLIIDIPIEKNYIDKVILEYKAYNVFAAKNACVSKATKLSEEKGIIIYDKILEISEKILDHSNAKFHVANRLNYIFVDEYQDIRLYQHLIFQKIINEGLTNFYCIGDPIQSIYGFSYTKSQLKSEPKPKSFDEYPIMLLKNSEFFDKEEISENNRCSSNIINFINKYIEKIEHSQKLPKNKSCNSIPVYYITGKDKSEIINKYQELLSNRKIQKEENKFYSLILARNWGTLGGLSINNLIKLQTSTDFTKTYFSEVSRCVVNSLGMKKSEIINFIDGNSTSEKHLNYREFCFYIMKEIKDKDQKITAEYIHNKFSERFGKIVLKSASKNIDIEYSLEKLQGYSNIKGSKNSENFCSSIHTAKGLEATSVLVIAKNSKELLKWLDFDNVTHKADDDYRLGYVAFSRAREILCITCLESCKEDDINLIKSLDIEVI